MTATSISLVPIKSGWAVMLSDGRELARFTGPGSRRRALRYVVSANPVRPAPSLDTVRQEMTRR